MKREGSGLAGTSVLAKALMEMTGKDAETIKAYLADKDQAMKLALRNSPKVKPFVDAIEAKKNAGKTAINTDALLAELG